MDLMPMGKFAMDYWATEAKLEGEPDDSQQEGAEHRWARLARWVDGTLCMASRVASRAGGWLERRGLPDLALADRLSRSGC
jgi:hypothetical protein